MLKYMTPSLNGAPKFQNKIRIISPTHAQTKRGAWQLLCEVVPVYAARQCLHSGQQLLKHRRYELFTPAFINSAIAFEIAAASGCSSYSLASQTTLEPQRGSLSVSLTGKEYYIL